MKDFDKKDLCPKCHAAKMKTWDELDFEEKIIAERLPASADFSGAERKKHLFCIKCWFEETENKNYLA